MIKNKRDVNLLKIELNYIQKCLALFTEDDFNQKINSLWEDLKIMEGNEKLKSIPMDVISTLEKGMPINLLVHSYFRTIYDIADQQPSDLMQINGIGEKSAYPFTMLLRK